MRLELHGLLGHVSAFADRPSRLTLLVRTAQFFRGWKPQFGTDPPNAALDVLDDNKLGDVVLELSNPRYANGSVVFDAHRIGRWVGGLGRHRSRPLTGSFTEASLFVDAGCFAQNNGAALVGLTNLSCDDAQAVVALWPVPLNPLGATWNNPFTETLGQGWSLTEICQPEGDYVYQYVNGDESFWGLLGNPCGT